jgi:hypothetical protein
MITASCIFYEGARKEATGQETWMGVCDTNQAYFKSGEPNSLFARVTVHIPTNEESGSFAIRLVDDAGTDELLSPSAELVAEGVRLAREGGFEVAALPATINLSAFSAPQATNLRLYLSVGRRETLIATVGKI